LTPSVPDEDKKKTLEKTEGAIKIDNPENWQHWIHKTNKTKNTTQKTKKMSSTGPTKNGGEPTRRRRASMYVVPAFYMTPTVLLI